MSLLKKYTFAILFSVFSFFILPTSSSYAERTSEMDYLQTKDIIKEGETFSPEKTMNRGEFVVWALKNAGFYGDHKGLEPFGDIDVSHPLYPYISTAWETGALKNFGTAFREQKKITRGEAVEILFSIEGISVPSLFETPSRWKDLPLTIRQKSLLVRAEEIGVLKETSPGHLSPKGKVSYQDAAEMLYTIALFKNNESASSSFSNYQKLQKVDTLVKNEYLYRKDLDETVLEESAIRGYLDGVGDPYTVYFTKEENEEFLKAVNGTDSGVEITGIGIMLGIDQEKNIIIMKVYPGTPAEREGLLSGDIITAIDGFPVDGASPEVISSKIRGEVETTVNITVTRDGQEKVFSILREKIVITEKNIWSETKENILWIHVNSFGDETGNMFKTILDTQITPTTKGVIVDLRGNPGGFIDTALEMLGEVLPKGSVGVNISSPGYESVRKASGSGTHTDIPLVVFQNEYSASASEMFAGAVQDYGRGKIIGQNSFGKGIAQSVIPFADGSTVKITTQEFKSPKGNTIHKIGIAPDITLKTRDDASFFNAAKGVFAK